MKNIRKIAKEIIADAMEDDVIVVEENKQKFSYLGIVYQVGPYYEGTK